MPFIQYLRNPSFLPDNALPYIIGIVRTFLDKENVRLIPWPTLSPDLSPIENVWSIVLERLARHHYPVLTVENRVEVAWMPVHVHAIQSPFDSMVMHIRVVITAKGGCSMY
ncbi:hypothetical protein TNCV_3470891 [Trichonephila clavipes]|nr:hypothetical protein TNCV_3470891 [Trichonephila clavipes]